VIGYVSEQRFTKFSEITQCNGHYAVQGHLRSPILVPIESSYTTFYYWLIITRWLLRRHNMESNSRAPGKTSNIREQLVTRWLLRSATNKRLILTYLLFYTVSKLWLIIGQIFASERGVPHFHALAGVIPCQYRHKWYIDKTPFFGLHFRYESIGVSSTTVT